MGAENLRGIGLMILAMALFAIEDIFLKFAAVDLPTGQIVFLSGALGMPVFFILARRAGVRVVSRGFLHPSVLARNFGEMVGTLGYITALALVPLATVSAVLQALPLGVTMAAALFLGEPVGWRRWSAIAVGFLGVLLVIQPGTAGFRPEALWVLLTVVGLTLRDLATRAIPVGSSTAQVSAWGLGSVALLGLFMMIWQGDWTMPTALPMKLNTGITGLMPPATPVAGLFDALAEVDGAAIQARWRAGLQAALRQLQFLEPGAERHGGRVPCPTGSIVVQPHVDFAVQESTRCQHDGLAAELNANLRHRAHHAVAFDHQVIHRLLEQPQVRLVLQHAANGGLV